MLSYETKHTLGTLWLKLLLIIFFKGRELRFGRSLVPFIMESGNLENVMDMVPTVCYSQKQRSMQGSTVVDGKMERSMYVFDILLYLHTLTHVCTL